MKLLKLAFLKVWEMIVTFKWFMRKYEIVLKVATKTMKSKTFRFNNSFHGQYRKAS